eukprot:TRINITY_DN48290_c0_g1_i1.p1 TRINITY_DN48290_c0_g1~~TRINITY_DN48290_c0_g1_i1.p1  ORF type:complete len:119 (-),score=16.10 TRINITY_DN48290_c0_g1_i1:318-674(-)
MGNFFSGNFLLGGKIFLGDLTNVRSESSNCSSPPSSASGASATLTCCCVSWGSVTAERTTAMRENNNKRVRCFIVVATKAVLDFSNDCCLRDGLSVSSDGLSVLCDVEKFPSSPFYTV